VTQNYKQTHLTTYSELIHLAQYIGLKLADLTSSDSTGKFETVLRAKEYLFDKELFYGGVFAQKFKTNTRIVSSFSPQLSLICKNLAAKIDPEFRKANPILIFRKIFTKVHRQIISILYHEKIR
jgi:hypothetical protein